MKKYDIVIIGGGPAGVTCAISAHTTYPDKTIALIRKEKVALIPCGIPYIIHSLNSVEEDILADELVTKTGADLIIDEVVEKEEKTLKLKSGKEIGYDKLVIATGSVPLLPPIQGVKKEGVFSVKKDYEYLSHMKKYAEKCQDIVIIGGGYIGVEMADEFIKNGKKVTIIEMLDRLLPTTMDREFGNKAQEVLESQGVKVIVGHRVNAIQGDKKVTGVVLNNNKEIKADLVLVSVGARPNVTLASRFGLAVHPRNGIWAVSYTHLTLPTN